jgi:hypothetical protein
VAQCLAEDLLDLADGRGTARERHRGAALEVNAKSEPAQQNAEDRDGDDGPADGVPEPTPPDHLESTGTGVEPG